MSEQKVKLENKTITVKKLPIGKYAELLKAVKELPTHLKGLGTLDNATIVANLPSLIGSATPDFINIVTIATELEKEEVEKLGADEFVRVVLAIYEVNNYREVFENLKKALARPTPQVLKTPKN